jgi:hypothetical protein
MSKILYQYLVDDHDRIENLFRRATGKAHHAGIDLIVYEEFRKALLRHISIEEKIAFPALSDKMGNLIKPVLTRLHLDHSAIVELLVPTPNASVIATISSILAGHNTFEEKPQGIYEMLETLDEVGSRSLLERFRSAPEVPTLSTKPLPQVIGAVRRSVERAGYEFIETED